jgi:hypothetical protein
VDRNSNFNKPVLLWLVTMSCQWKQFYDGNVLGLRTWTGPFWIFLKNLFCNLQAAFWGPHQLQKHWFRNCVIYITHNWEFLLPVKMSFWCWHNLPIQCLTTLKKLPKIGTGRMFHSTIIWFQIDTIICLISYIPRFAREGNTDYWS